LFIKHGLSDDVSTAFEREQSLIEKSRSGFTIMIIALLKFLGALMLLFIIVVILIVLGIFQKLFGKGTGIFAKMGGSRPVFGGGTGVRGGRGAEICPSCHQLIFVGEKPGNCPRCGTLLGRNHEGRLLIRIN